MIARARGDARALGLLLVHALACARIGTFCLMRRSLKLMKDSSGVESVTDALPCHVALFSIEQHSSVS